MVLWLSLLLLLLLLLHAQQPKPALCQARATLQLLAAKLPVPFAAVLVRNSFDPSCCHRLQTVFCDCCPVGSGTSLGWLYVCLTTAVELNYSPFTLTPPPGKCCVVWSWRCYL